MPFVPGRGLFNGKCIWWTSPVSRYCAMSYGVADDGNFVKECVAELHCCSVPVLARTVASNCCLDTWVCARSHHAFCDPRTCLCSCGHSDDTRTRAGHPTAWTFADGTLTATENKAPGLISASSVTGSVPPQIALFVSMYVCCVVLC